MKTLQHNRSNQDHELTPLQRLWREFCIELGREDGNARLIAIAVLGGLLSIAILMPLVMT